MHTREGQPTQRRHQQASARARVRAPAAALRRTMHRSAGQRAPSPPHLPRLEAERAAPRGRGERRLVDAAEAPHGGRGGRVVGEAMRLPVPVGAPHGSAATAHACCTSLLPAALFIFAHRFPRAAALFFFFSNNNVRSKQIARVGRRAGGGPDARLPSQPPAPARRPTPAVAARLFAQFACRRCAHAACRARHGCVPGARGRRR